MFENKQFKGSIYQISSGTSKTRSLGNGEMQKQNTWKMIGISSGEESGGQKLAKINIQDVTEGRMIRFLDIHVKGQIFTDFDGNVMDDIEAEKLASNIKEQCGQNFGHAGRVFINRLLNLANSKEQLQTIVAEKMDDMFLKLTADVELEPEERRAMRYFAMILAGAEFAIDFGILPMTKELAFESVLLARNLWLGEMKHMRQQKEKKNSFDLILRAWLMNNLTSFQPLTDLKPKKGGKGYTTSRLNSSYGDNYLLPSNVFEDIFAGHKLSDVCAELHEKGILLAQIDKTTGEVERYQIPYRVASITGNDGYGAVLRLYTIKASFLDSQDEVADKMPSQPQQMTLTPEMYAMMQKLLASQQPA
jgi:hypothetical protein